MITVLKFGGTSVGSPEALTRVANIIVNGEGSKAVVVSAMSGITNFLESIVDDPNLKADDALASFEKKHEDVAKQLFDDKTLALFMAEFRERINSFADLLNRPDARKDPYFKDAVVSQGERFSSLLLAHLLNKMGYKAVALLSRGQFDLRDAAAARDYLVGSKIARSGWPTAADAPLTKGRLAYMVCQALGIKGGVTMRLFGPSQRYCLAECQYLELMTGGADYEHVTGGELVSVIDRADQYRQSKGQAAEPQPAAQPQPRCERCRPSKAASIPTLSDPGQREQDRSCRLHSVGRVCLPSATPYSGSASRAVPDRGCASAGRVR